MRTYDYRHTVTFEDTNVAGNVYYANHVRWQGRCREMFLLDHAPSVVRDLAEGLLLVTTRCSCEYLAELMPMDEVIIRMSLRDMAQNRVTMGFEYLRVRDGAEELVARGEQQIATMRREGGRAVAAPLPTALRAALEPYQVVEELRRPDIGEAPP